MRIWPASLAAVVLLAAPAMAAPATARERIAGSLREAAHTGRVPSTFAVTYRSEGSFWGPETFVLRGDGRLTRSGPGPTDAPETRTVRVSRGEVLAVVRLLVKLEAWRQRPVRRPSDGIRAHVVIRIGPARTAVWEWENHLGVGPTFRALKIRLINLASRR